MLPIHTKRIARGRRTVLRMIASCGLGTSIIHLTKGTVNAESSDRRNIVQVTGGTGDLGRKKDQGHYYYDPSVRGDFDLVVHCTDVEHTHDWAKAGIMIRDSLDPRAPHLMVRRIPDEGPTENYGLAQIQWRPRYGEEAEIRIDTMRQVGIRAEWLRLKCVDDTFKIYGSMTGSNWEQFGEFTTDEVDLGNDVIAGLAVTSGEYDWNGLCTATFKDLSGFSPSKSVDLGDATPKGDVTIRDDIPITDTHLPEVNATSLVLTGSLYLPSDYSSATCYFQHREVTEEDWTTTDSQTLTESGPFDLTVPVTSRHIYEIRAIADVPGAPEIPEAIPTRGATLLISTPSRANGGNEDQKLSAGVSNINMDDGFAPVAPWLDDDTPIIKITEPTYEALDEAFRIPHERLIVFETSGVIDLRGNDLAIRSDKCHVAGQTAPSPGITFINGSLEISADDCILQHIRVRPGDYKQDVGWAPDAIDIQDERKNNIVDHCTTTWGIDENTSIGGKTKNTTYSNNLIAEALRDSTHPEGNHSMGSLINPNAENVALLGNVWANNENRNPRLRLGSRNVTVNNLIYNYNDGCWMDPQSRASIEGNLYLKPTTDQPNIFSESPEEYGEGVPKAHLEDNATDRNVPMIGEGVEQLDSRPLWPKSLTPIPSGEIKEHNLMNAGARPADRTYHDKRIIQGIRDGKTQWIDSQEEVGGYPDLSVNIHSLNVPQGGTRAWLRQWSRRVEAVYSEK